MTIENNQEFSDKKLSELTYSISRIDELGKYQDLCILVTGAYGRREADSYSGIDLLYIKAGKQGVADLPKLSKTIIDAEIIKILDLLGFPPFSNKDKFLTIHYLENLIDDMGSSRDDHNDSFSTRISCLTEGIPVCNEGFYSVVLRRIITAYCRGLYDHAAGITPVFILNDIARYWKGYPLKNLLRRDWIEIDLWSHVCNLKQAFSRKLACYSFIFLLMSRRLKLTETDLVEIARMSPWDRLNRLKIEVPGASPISAEITDQYIGFLELYSQSTESLKSYFDSEETRRDFYVRGEVQFSGKIFEMLRLLSSADSDLLQCLVV
jgi:hypothetical protein